MKYNPSVRRQFGDEKESEIVKLIIAGKKNAEIKSLVGFRSNSKNVNYYRRALLEGDPRIAKIAEVHYMAAAERIAAITDELSRRLPDMPTGELLAAVVGLSDSLRRARGGS